MIESRRPAVIRGSLSATLAIFIALAGHVSGGGTMPGPLGLLVPWVLSLMVSVLLAGKKLSVVRLALAVGISQFLFHVLFVLGTVTPSGAPVSGHVHGAPLVLPAGDGVADVVVTGGSMWIGHLVAALVTVVALHRGERLAHAATALAARAARWLQRRADATVPPALPAARVLRHAFLSAPLRPASPLLATLRGRAPPAVPAI